jgi:cell division septum initiation protein DivIVA
VLDEWNWQADQVKAARARLLEQAKKASKRHLKLRHKPTAEELALAAKIDAATQQALASADQVRLIMQSNDPLSWPTWVGLGLVGGGVIAALLIGPELVAAAAGIAVAEAAETAAATIIEIAATNSVRTVSVASFIEGADLATGGGSTEMLSELTQRLAEAGLHVVEAAPDMVYRHAR